MADLITLEEYRALMAVDPTDTREDPQITALLPAVSRTVRQYTGRQFDASNSVATARSYQYDGTGFLDIDDCTNVTLVSTDWGIPGGLSYTLDPSEWTPMPQDGTEVYYYLMIQGGPFGFSSPEMGFERNLDTIQFRVYKRPLLSVTAAWGWPQIPEDVKLATALIVSSLLGESGSKSESLSAESIESYSRTWGSRTSATQSLFIPNRARDILAGYVRALA